MPTGAIVLPPRGFGAPRAPMEPTTPYDPDRVILYRRNRFQSRLPKAYRYTAAHFWLAELSPGLWRVGFTRFATRMLGEIVEHGFEADGRPVAVGQAVKV